MSSAITASVADTPLFSGLLERLENNLRILPDKPAETPWNTLVCLWSLVAGRPIALSEIDEVRLATLGEDAAARLAGLVDQRLSGIPLAHITERQDFMGMVLLASPAALVPRKETELLGNAAAEKANRAPAAAPLILDICTGAGNLALGIASRVPAARVFGSDLSTDAVSLARRNAQFLGREDVEFRLGDLIQPFNEPDFVGAVDVLVCNPPYISTTRVDSMPAEISRYEPRLAFDGGPFGVNILHRLVSEAPTWLKQKAWLLFEVGRGQGEQALRLVQKTGHFGQVEALRDDRDDIRGIAAQMAARSSSV